MHHMDGERSKRAIARIEDALARIEAAARRPVAPAVPASDEEIEDLRRRHARLRSAVVQSLEQIDAMIESQGS